MEDGKDVKKEEPCFDASGILAEFSNRTREGVVLKFTEPLDAAVPTGKNEQWVIYPFKGEEALGKESSFLTLIEPIHLGLKRSCYLFGRDNRVADIMLENPSCSMQHAVI